MVKINGLSIHQVHNRCLLARFFVVSGDISAHGWYRNVASPARFSLTLEPDPASEDVAGKGVPLEEEEHEHGEYAGGGGEFAQREVAVVARVEILVV